MTTADFTTPFKVSKATVITRAGEHYTIDKDILKERIIEVHINDTPSMSITCTPTHLRELIVGRLRSEGYISTIECIRSLDFSEDFSSVSVVLNREEKPSKQSFFEVIPSTGGNSETLNRPVFPTKDLETYKPVMWNRDTIFDLYGNFALDTPLHSLTKGTHSCRLAVNSDIVFVSEDIGRHNALDKAIGYSLTRSIDISRSIFFVSGRIPVDMATKAIRARIPVLASKAAPTDQAVILARKYGLTLICLITDEQLLVFSGAEAEFGGKAS